MAAVLVCGSVNWDTTCFVDHLPSPGEEVMCDQVSEVSGGTGANTAVAAARILGPEQVAFLGALGRDRIARRQVATLQAEGVMPDGIVHLRTHGSGHAYILVDRTGQNVIASDLGANAAMDARHVTSPRTRRLLSQCRCMALTDPPLTVVKAMLDASAPTDVPILWDPGVNAQLGWDTLAPLTTGVDSLIVNEAEARQLYNTEEPEDILRGLDLRGAPSCIVLKRGPRGSILLECATGITTHIPPLPLNALGLTVVSTVGCGDVFLGTYAAFLSRGLDRAGALIAASAAAGLNATSPETRAGPTRLALEEAMHRAAQLGFGTTPQGGASP